MSDQHQETPDNVLEMSDADIAQMDFPFDEPVPAEDSSEQADQEPVEGEVEEDSADDTLEEGSASEDSEEGESSEDAEVADDDESGSDEVSDENTDTDQAELDYESEYKKILAPFKANGKEMQVESVDDALTLMKMGANYNKKMAGLKPNLKLLKMLENNELLDESKLSYLIDLDKKNPAAIAQLVKDSGIDPLDITPEEGQEYKPESHKVNDAEVELDAVLEEIQDTDTYQDTIDTVSKQWDESSRKVIVDNPQIIKVINDQKANGVFDQISKVVEREKMLGRLNGLSDLEAYRQVGDQIHAEGGFTQKEETPAEANEPVQPTVPKTQADPNLKNKKRAASPTKSTPRKAVTSDFNPLSLSDEEFDKLVSSKYL